MELSEQVKSCQDVVRVVVPLLRERAEKTGEALSLVLGAFLGQGQTPPDGAALLLLVARAIEVLQERLEAADLAHARELGDDVEPRNKRDKAAAAVYSELTELRVEIEAFYGAVAIRALGMSGDTPQDPPRLERLARDVAGRLLDEKFSLGEPKKARMTYDRKSAGAELLGGCGTLKPWIDKVDQEVAEAKTTLKARAQALAEWQEKVPKLCALARGVLLTAGDVEGAGRIVSTPYRSPSPKPEEEKKPQ